MLKQSKTLIVSPLEKIFPETDISKKTAFGAFSMLKNEKSSFQLAYAAKKGDEVRLMLSSELSAFITPYEMRLVPSRYAAPKDSDDYYLKKEAGLYPDLLSPIEAGHFTAERDGSGAIWFEIKSKNLLPTGVFGVQIDIQIGRESGSQSLEIEVIDAVLPKQTLIYTNWFHTDCLMSYYKVKAFSEEYWCITENFLRRAHEYGMNCVLTPLFTPPLDTKIGGERPTVQLTQVKVTGRNKYVFGFDRLDRWLEMCGRCGIEYFEMSHLFTQWGARHAPKIVAEKDGREKRIFGWETRAGGRRYRLFLEQFAEALTVYIDSKGIRQNCFFHISDEPGIAVIPAYRRAGGLVRGLFGGFRFIDAMSDFKIYQKGLIDIPIPANNHIAPFLGKTPELWTYYCCGQGDGYVSNRFFAMPSQRTRVLGFQLYKFDVRGFLHWGYNYYYAHLTDRVVDPYEETNGGGALPSGDGFIVYPGGGGAPLNSLRLHVLYDGFQDMMALQLLESRLGREKTLALLEEGLERPLSFGEYPHSAEWQLAVRERVNRAISVSYATNNE